MGKTAIILGATGLTGGILLNKLLLDERYTSIKVFGRSSTGKKHKKLSEFICDLLDPETYQNDFMGDEVYCCIGTTASKTPNKELYRKIDYGIPVSVAKLCHKKGIDTLLVVSAMGANKNSTVFYNRIKGEMEQDVLKQKVKRTYLIQPALIGGERDEKRILEWIFKKLFTVLNFILVGSLKKYRSIEPTVIANAMIKLANSDKKTRRIPSDLLAEIGK
ncbi:NAD(P)H-binding protein [Ascidiimonas sp. W6]|uniref:NAD(P)H-binding protein n=1 Tax=Ascidiimonas meishanensis TaxID=3128903 RepID=UPI0030EBE89F